MFKWRVYKWTTPEPFTRVLVRRNRRLDILKAFELLDSFCSDGTPEAIFVKGVGHVVGRENYLNYLENGNGEMESF